MSIPSSSEAVATTARQLPAFRASSAARRRSGLRLPWWALRNSDRGSASTDRPILASDLLRPCSLRWAVSRSTTRRLLAKTIVDRCARIRSSSRRSIAGQTEPAGGVTPLDRER